MEIEILNSVNNPASIHGIYPYRGKISAKDAQAIIAKLDKGKTLLDPFCGSGTILYEAARNNMNVIGFDTNPIAIWLSKGKMDMREAKSLDFYLDEIETLIVNAKQLKKPKEMPSDALRHFHKDTADEIMRVAEVVDKYSDYIKSCFFGAIALAARGCNHYKWTSNVVGKDIIPKRYIDFYSKLRLKVKKHYYPLGSSAKLDIYKQDSRKLSKYIKPKSVDYVFTSPPYFDALDYTAYYAKIIYSILGYDRAKIRSLLIQTTSTYKQDMKKVLDEILKVTHNESKIIFVVGDKKLKSGIINGGEFFSDLLHHEPTTVFERSYSGTSSQVFDKINKTNRKEQIVVWDRSHWSE